MPYGVTRPQWVKGEHEIAFLSSIQTSFGGWLFVGNVIMTLFTLSRSIFNLILRWWESYRSHHEVKTWKRLQHHSQFVRGTLWAIDFPHTGLVIQLLCLPRNMHTVFALLCFVVVIHWLIFPYPSGLLHWHCGNLTIAPVPAKQPWWIWINTSCEFIMNDCITTTKQSTTKPCAYFLGYTVLYTPYKHSGPRLNIKTVLSTYGDFHVKDKTAVRTSYL